MLRIYILVFVIAILGGIGYGAKYYYDTTQATIATLRENNVKLESAVETAEQSVATLQQDMVKIGELNKELSGALQKAEAYGDELRTKLSKLNLVVEALKDSKVLEGK
jgi:ABC-type transporter Mla subunit MlaD